MTEENKNPFIQDLKKNIGKEIIVTMFTPQEKEQIKGKCIAIDFIQKSVILDDGTAIITIPRYLYLERKR